MLVLASTYLDPLPTGPEDEHAGRRMLSALEADAVARVTYRTDRNPELPVEAKELAGIHAVIADLETYSRTLLARVGRAAGGSLELIARYGVGVDAVDLDAAEDYGVAVANTPGANSLPTAELALTALLDLACRRIPLHLRAAAGLRKTGPSRLDVTGSTVGVVGTGRVGRRLVDLLAGFRPTIVAFDPAPDPAWAAAAGVRYLPLDELLPICDFVSVHASSRECILGPREISLLRPTSCLVNCARTHLVDTEAVHAAVAHGRLFGYALDDPWPRPDLSLDGLNIVTSPHVGSDTDGGKAAMRRMSAAAVDEWLRTGSTTYRIR